MSGCDVDRLTYRDQSILTAEVKSPLCRSLGDRDRRHRQRKLLGPVRASKQLHLGLLRRPPRLAGVAGVTRRHDVLPHRSTTQLPRIHVVVVQLPTRSPLSAVLAREIISSQNVGPRELYALLVERDLRRKPGYRRNLKRHAWGSRHERLSIPCRFKRLDVRVEQLADRVLPRNNPVRLHPWS